MNFNENDPLKKYADEANQKFAEAETRMDQIERTMDTRMDGKSKAGIVVSMIGTICWAVAICIFFGFIRGNVNNTFHTICLVISLVFLGLMFIDEATSYSYYGKISNYRDDISRLRHRISQSKSSIAADQETFMKSGSNEWNHPLSAGTSIPQEIASIEDDINSMKPLNSGLIHDLKNFLFFVFAVAFTIVGSMGLFDVAGEIIENIFSVVTSTSYDFVRIVRSVGLVITVIGEIILAKLVWSKTDCSVTNVTLFIAAAGPVLFLAVTSVGIILVGLAAGLVGVAIFAVSAVLGVGCLSLLGESSGG